MIYLDNNATTALLPAAAREMTRVWDLGALNPSSQHARGRLARAELDRAATEIGRLLGADIQRPGGEQLIFTSGGTEANNLALHGLATPAVPLIVSRIEHPSLLEVAQAWQARGRQVEWLPVDARGVVDLNFLQAALQRFADARPVVCVMAANNETGVLQPIAEAAQLCRTRRAHLHVDATQWVGKLPLDFATLQADSLVFAAHKFHGPVGVGGLLLAPGVSLQAQWQGGAQQLGLRPGTEPVALAVGTAVALRAAVEQQATTMPAIQRLRDRFEQALTETFPDLVVHGRDAPRLAGTSCLGFPHVDRQSMLMALDLAGIACSSGSACASGSSEPSYVLQAMGVPAEWLDGSLRFGLSKFSTETEISQATRLISNAYKRLRDLCDVEK